MLLVEQNLPDKRTTVASADDPETSLLHRVIQQDRQAFQQLYLIYHERLYRFMYRMLRQPEQVTELVDDVMLIVWQKAGDFKGESKISTWIMGIAHNTALKAYRKNKQYREKHVSDYELEQISDRPEVNPENITSRDQVYQQIQSSLEMISEDKRSVVELTMQGYSYPEIAEIVNCPVNTVKTRMFHARKELKKALQRKHLTGEDL